jgi:hypothetical protein
MKRRKKLKEAAVVPTAAVAVPAARTQKKKKKTATTSAKQNLDLLSGIDEESIYSHKPPLRICHHMSPTSSEILLA